MLSSLSATTTNWVLELISHTVDIGLSPDTTSTVNESLLWLLLCADTERGVSASQPTAKYWSGQETGLKLRRGDPSAPISSERSGAK